jgi:hypothetical protein
MLSELEKRVDDPVKRQKIIDAAENANHPWSFIDTCINRYEIDRWNQAKRVAEGRDLASRRAAKAAREAVVAERVRIGRLRLAARFAEAMVVFPGRCKRLRAAHLTIVLCVPGSEAAALLGCPTVNAVHRMVKEVRSDFAGVDLTAEEQEVFNHRRHKS